MSKVWCLLLFIFLAWVGLPRVEGHGVLPFSLPVYDNATGHYFSLAQAADDWYCAFSYTSGAWWNGYQGYFASISSASEQVTVETILTQQGFSPSDAKESTFFLGGLEVNPPNTKWEWYDGPEKGHVFSNGSQCAAGAYCNWAAGQPNDANGYYLSMRVGGPNAYNFTWTTTQDNDTNEVGFFVEFGGTAQMTPYPVSSSTVPGTTLQITQGSPDFQYGPSTNFFNGAGVFFNFFELAEVNDSGEVVASFTFPAEDWLFVNIPTGLVAGRTEVYVYTTPIPNSQIQASNGSPQAGISVRLDLWNQSAEVQFGTTPFALLAGSLKWSLSILDWPWQDSANTLRLSMAVETPAGPQSLLDMGTSSDGTILTLQIPMDPPMAIYLPLQVTIDNVVTLMSPLPSVDNSTNIPTNNSIVFYIPHFTTSLVYDPAVSVLLTGSGDGSSNNLLPLLALLVLIIPISFVLVAAVVLVWIYIRRRRFNKATHRAQPSAVNFD